MNTFAMNPALRPVADTPVNRNGGDATDARADGGSLFDAVLGALNGTQAAPANDVAKSAFGAQAVDTEILEAGPVHPARLRNADAASLPAAPSDPGNPLEILSAAATPRSAQADSTAKAERDAFATLVARAVSERGGPPAMRGNAIAGSSFPELPAPSPALPQEGVARATPPVSAEAPEPDAASPADPAVPETTAIPVVPVDLAPMPLARILTPASVAEPAIAATADPVPVETPAASSEARSQVTVLRQETHFAPVMPRSVSVPVETAPAGIAATIARAALPASAPPVAEIARPVPEAVAGTPAASLPSPATRPSSVSAPQAVDFVSPQAPGKVDGPSSTPGPTISEAPGLTEPGGGTARDDGRLPAPTDDVVRPSIVRDTPPASRIEESVIEFDTRVAQPVAPAPILAGDDRPVAAFAPDAAETDPAAVRVQPAAPQAPAPVPPPRVMAAADVTLQDGAPVDSVIASPHPAGPVPAMPEVQPAAIGARTDVPSAMAIPSRPAGAASRSPAPVTISSPAAPLPTSQSILPVTERPAQAPIMRDASVTATAHSEPTSGIAPPSDARVATPQAALHRAAPGEAAPAAGAGVSDPVAPAAASPAAQPASVAAPGLAGASPPNPVVSQIAEAVTAEVLRAAPVSSTGQAGAEGPLRILTLQLRPMDLGNVVVRMRLRGSQLEMSLHANREETAEILRKDGAVLSALLRDAGYRADAVTIGAPIADANGHAPASSQGFGAGAGGQGPARDMSDQPGRRQPEAVAERTNDTRERTNETNPAGPDRSGTYL